MTRLRSKASDSPSRSQDESHSYGNCSECKQKQTAVAWCKNCDIAIFKENFCSWTSGNSIIFTNTNVKITD
ncbi:hypothetical protein RhiirC2_788364 [Rhizophagus irregularis]|uniref:Uncharacterized protein n=1 Tax=Rhizophagus irregularis TaxID=588596 RepID=A0A2N1MQB0_9GLOM|nr:hypothetical protein RhiirC2_788364 [Rhizophagus irregularis]